MSSETLAQSTAVSIRDMILHGRFVSGERLVELALARDLAVSQNTIRDALRILEQDGWVVKQARRGVYVRRFNAEEADEVYALLAALESLGLERAIKAMTRSRLADLRKLLASARIDAQIGDRAAAVEALFNFHEILSASTHRPLTAEILARLYTYARLLERLRQARAPGSAAEMDAQIEAHETLLKHLEQGDAEASRAALAAQLNAYRDMILPVLAR